MTVGKTNAAGPKAPSTYANTLTQEMVHEPAHLWRKEVVECLAEETTFVEKTKMLNLPMLSTAWPTRFVAPLCQCCLCWGIIACCGLSWTGRRGRKVFPVWPSKEIWDALFLRICIKFSPEDPKDSYMEVSYTNRPTKAAHNWILEEHRSLTQPD